MKNLIETDNGILMYGKCRDDMHMETWGSSPLHLLVLIILLWLLMFIKPNKKKYVCGTCCFASKS